MESFGSKGSVLYIITLLTVQAVFCLCSVLSCSQTEPFVDVLNNVLVETNLPGFEQLGTGTQTLLDTAEVIGNYIARAVASDDTVTEIRISRPNIGEWGMLCCNDYECSWCT